MSSAINLVPQGPSYMDKTRSSLPVRSVSKGRDPSRKGPVATMGARRRQRFHLDRLVLRRRVALPVPGAKAIRLVIQLLLMDGTTCADGKLLAAWPRSLVSVPGGALRRRQNLPVSA
jgi:hypothetical protein